MCQHFHGDILGLNKIFNWRFVIICLKTALLRRYVNYWKCAADGLTWPESAISKLLSGSPTDFTLAEPIKMYI